MGLRVTLRSVCTKPQVQTGNSRGQVQPCSREAMANMGLYSQAHQPMLQSMSAILLREGVKELYFRDFLQSCVWVDEKETGIMACMKRFNAYIRPLVLDGVQEDRVPQWDLRIYRAVVKGYFPQIYILLRIREKLTGRKWGIRR